MLVKLLLKLKSKRFPILKEWGWVFFIICLCFFARAQASSFRQNQIEILKQKIHFLKETKIKKQQLLDNSRLKLQSASDPEMVKMLLMKGLGLVKEGQMKVIFEESIRTTRAI